ncbi:MAG: hypothetical protein O6829_10195, partial [Alphaproteobacteria bacterium]|nr:hypothetical protein [Alphaproteobacteria bacterium]
MALGRRRVPGPRCRRGKLGLQSGATLGMKLGSLGFPNSASLGSAPSELVPNIQTIEFSTTCRNGIIPKSKSIVDIICFIFSNCDLRNILLRRCFNSPFHTSNRRGRTRRQQADVRYPRRGSSVIDISAI